MAAGYGIHRGADVDAECACGEAGFRHCPNCGVCLDCANLCDPSDLPAAETPNP